MLRRSYLLIIVLLLQSCVLARDTNSALAWLFHKTSTVETKNVVVLLPGIHNSMYSFRKVGFFEDIERFKPDFDVVTVDAHLGYYFDGRLAEQLHDDVIRPVKSMGYENIVMAGISLGGYGSLWYNHEYGEEIKGLVLFSPFLGTDDVIKEIKVHNGVKQWREEVKLSDIDFGGLVWHWIDDDIEHTKTVLAYGTEDKFSEAAKLLADYLPAEQVQESYGGHDWPTWKALWFELLYKGKISELFH